MHAWMQVQTTAAARHTAPKTADAGIAQVTPDTHSSSWQPNLTCCCRVCLLEHIINGLPGAGQLAGCCCITTALLLLGQGRHPQRVLAVSTAQQQCVVLGVPRDAADACRS
jgi:hypothetical protein